MRRKSSIYDKATKGIAEREETSMSSIEKGARVQ